MQITSLIGIVAGIGAVIVGQVAEGGSVMALVQPTAAMIVIGGTVGALLLMFPGKDIMGALTGLKVVFLGADIDFPGTIELVADLATKARKEGILALQASVSEIQDPFLKKGIEMVTDGIDPHLSDSSKLGAGIAVAFVATVYGVGFANLICIPLATKLKLSAKPLIIMREMMLHGVLAIQAGESPNFIKQKLRVYDITGASAKAGNDEK